jgi:hypothetical protein
MFKSFPFLLSPPLRLSSRRSPQVCAIGTYTDKTGQTECKACSVRGGCVRRVENACSRPTTLESVWFGDSTREPVTRGSAKKNWISKFAFYRKMGQLVCACRYRLGYQWADATNSTKCSECAKGTYFAGN